MNRKFLAGAAASLMLTALPVALSAPAGAKAPVAQPTVTGATIDAAVAGNVNGGLYNGNTIGYSDYVSINLTGTNLNNVKKGDITISNAGASVASGWSVKKIVAGAGGTSAVVNAYAPSITFYLLNHNYPSEPNGGVTHVKFAGKYASAVDFDITGTYLGSNCGPLDATQAPGSKPINGTTNQPYVAGDFGSGAGQTPVSLQSTLLQSASIYSNVYLKEIVGLGAFNTGSSVLCASDLNASATKTGIAATTTSLNHAGFYSWATNFPLYFSTPVVGSSQVKSLGFTMPYTSNNSVQVSNTLIKYQVAPAQKSNVTGCHVAAPAGQKASKLAAGNAVEDTSSGINNADWKKSTCSYNASTGVITVTDSQKHTYSVGTFLNAPGIVIDKTGPASISVNHITSTIKLGATINIGFDPDPASANATAAVFSW